MQRGLTETKIAGLETYKDSNAFTVQEKLALRFAELMVLNHQDIDDDFFRSLRAHFTEPQIVELGVMIGQYIGLGRLVASLDLARPAPARQST